MKHSLIALGALMALAACAPAPKTADELRSAAKSSMFAEIKTQKVNRSYGSVVASLRAGSKKCLNRNVQETSTTWNGGPYGPQTQTTNTYYTSTVKSGRSRTELALNRRMGGGGQLFGIGPDMEGLMYVVDARPVSGGTALDFYGGKWGYGGIDAAVLQWAQGGAIRCPDLP